MLTLQIKMLFKMLTDLLVNIQILDSAKIFLPSPLPQNIQFSFYKNLLMFPNNLKGELLQLLDKVLQTL